jgi:UDP-2-acetamido-2,6-beta-L-arabino-hexul-4-ose reductase
VTGGEGFIARNLRARLRELGHADVGVITRATGAGDFKSILEDAEYVFHLAGVNRPQDPREYSTGNEEFTRVLCRALATNRRHATVVFGSSTQASLDNPYGRSKLAAEQVLRDYAGDTGADVRVFRLPNVFGKWARPGHNSVVATFCHNIAHGMPVTVHDPAAPLRLIYVDDVVDAFVSVLANATAANQAAEIGPVYQTTVGDLAQTLREFADSRDSLFMPRVGTGLIRALYSTYVSYLPAPSFDYAVPCRVDARGEFVEMLKTPDCGQLSYFTAHPGITRGEHYHHSKTEKFLVIQGTACFEFRQIESGERHEVMVRGGEGRIVESVPGWAHNVTNVGGNDLIVMLWANEIFDRQRPDTISLKVRS